MVTMGTATIKVLHYYDYYYDHYYYDYYYDYYYYDYYYYRITVRKSPIGPLI